VAILYICWLFGIFLPFWYVVARKIWQPCIELIRWVFRENKKKAVFVQKLFLSKKCFFFSLFPKFYLFVFRVKRSFFFQVDENPIYSTKVDGFETCSFFGY
jgi:hypothetical protein